MNLLPSEAVLKQTARNTLTLSTHRVRYETQAMGIAEIKSIMLEELASIVMVSSSNVIFIVFAVVALVLGVLVAANGRRMEGALVLGVFVALVFVILFFATRRQVLSLASAGATITVNTQGMKIEAIKEFIERTEAAKNERFLLAKRA